MRKLKLLGFPVLLLTVLAATTAKAEELAAPPMPAAMVKTNEFVFPRVIEGVEIEHTFIIRNAGNAPLLISNVLSG